MLLRVFDLCITSKERKRTCLENTRTLKCDITHFTKIPLPVVPKNITNYIAHHKYQAKHFPPIIIYHICIYTFVTPICSHFVGTTCIEQSSTFNEVYERFEIYKLVFLNNRFDRLITHNSKKQLL